MNTSTATRPNVLDVRTYKLVPRGRDQFDRIFREGVLPMLGRHGIEIAAYGPSLDDEDHYCLIRVFASSRRALNVTSGSTASTVAPSGGGTTGTRY